MLADDVKDDVKYVIGVDTHADSHALALVDARTQRTCRSLTIAASGRGYRRALRLARKHVPERRVWALEGTGSYGAGFARFLASRGERVLEVERPRREGRRGRLKSDALDAERAARLALSAQAGAPPRLGSQAQALRALLTTREGAVCARTAALNELRALVVTAPPELRERLHGLSRSALVEACARLRPGGADSERAAAHSRFARSPCACGSCEQRPRRSRRSSPSACTSSLPACSPGAGSGLSARPRSSSPGRSRGGCARRRRSRVSPVWRRFQRARARSSATVSTAAAIGA